MSSQRRRSERNAGDAGTRERAQTVFEGPLVVEAGAGTGKTNILIARIVVWSLGRGWERAASRVEESAAGKEAPEPAARNELIAAQVMGRTAAITFTEAAAAEMARRTGEVFAEIAAGRVPEGVLEAALPADARERRARAQALIGALDHLLVRTIHAFCRGLLAQYPLEAGIHPGFQVDAEARVQDEVVREVVEATIAAAYAADADSDLLQLALDGIGPTAIEAAVSELIAAGVSPDVFDADPFAPERIADIDGGLAAAAAAFQQVDAGRLAEAKKTPTARIASDAVESTRQLGSQGGVATAADLQSFAGAVKEIWHEKAFARLMKWAADDFGAGETDAIAGDGTAVAAAAAGLRSRIAGIRELQPDRLERARRSLQQLLRDARSELRRRGASSFSSLLHDARNLLVQHPDVGRRVRTELDQLLVDEFQDTDPLQCEVIRCIALTGPAEQRPGLFLVGDPKQSIYGWRNADLRAYDAFIKDVLGDGVEPDRLLRNFRSVPGVLEAVDHAIEPVMRREDGVQPEFQSLIPDREPLDESPAVEHWVSWVRDADGEPKSPTAAEAAALEAAAIARDLRQRHSRGEVAWSEVGILFRSTGDLEIYLQALRAADIPYAVERDRGYYRRREIIEVSALVRCVLDRNDQLALVAWLRSVSVGLPDAALVPLWRRGFPRRVAALHGADAAALAELDEMVTAAAGEVPRDVPGVERITGWDTSLCHALRVVAILRASFDEDATDVFIEKLRNHSLLEASESARYLGAYRAANLDRFFRDVEAELAMECDRETLLRRLRTGVMEAREAEEARPRSADDAVRVMTIHKAKGLAFHHTYVVQLHKRSAGRRERVPPPTVERVNGVDEYRLFGAPTLNFGAVLEQRARVEAAERIRSLYVAMTRARDRLVLLGNWSPTPGEIAPEAARSHLDLLGSRSPGVPDLAARMRDLAEAGEVAVAEAATCWVFPSLHPPAPDAAPSGDRARPRAPALARAAADELREHRRLAALRAQRPWNGTPSADSHSEEYEERARRGFSDESSTAEPTAASTGNPNRSAARVAGTVVHRMLEDFDLGTDPATELARQGERAPTLVAALAGAPDRAAARERVAAVLAALDRGSLLERLCALAADVVSRELPVLLPPDGDDGVVGFQAGAIDLVYRDPDSHEWVIADYKTDPVANDAEVAERVAHYTDQGRAYQRALREAFDLEVSPRFELWFLTADRIEVVA